MRSISNFLRRCAVVVLLFLTLLMIIIIYRIDETEKLRNTYNDINTTTHTRPYDGDICDIDLRNPSADYRYDEFITRAIERLKIADSFCGDKDYQNMTWAKAQPGEGELARLLIVDDIHKVLYMPTFKGGSTSWGMIFAHILLPRYQQLDKGEILEEVKFQYFKEIPYMRKLPMEEQEKRLKTYFKFAFVREPFNRLLSAFRDKFMNPKNTYYRQRHVAKIHIHEKSFNKSANDKDTTAMYHGMIYSFRSFIRYIVNTKPGKYDPHWALYSWRLIPCWMQYNFIGKLETMEEDFNYLSKCRLHQGSYSSIFPSRVKTHANEHFDKFYKTVDKNDLIKLFEIFKLEYEQYGYEIPNIVVDAYIDRNLGLKKNN